MATGRISSTLQKRINFYLKSTESGNEKQKNGMEELPQKCVKVTQTSVVRRFTKLHEKRPQIEKHSSSISHISVSQNLSSQPSQNIELKQQNTSNKSAGSLAGVPVKNTMQELKAKLAKVGNQNDNVSNRSPNKKQQEVRDEMAKGREAYKLDEPNRVAAEAKADAKIAEALAHELAQQAANKTNAQAEPTQVKLQFDANGVPTSTPPLPPPSFLTPSRSIELKPQDKSKQQTSTLVKLPPEDLMQELKAKLAKVGDQNDNVSNRSPNKKQQEVRDEMAKGREVYKLDEPNRVAAEAKADAKIAEALAHELAQQAANKTNAQAEPTQVKLQFDANGVPTSAPPLPSF